jgi:hypothetical protein
MDHLDKNLSKRLGDGEILKSDNSDGTAGKSIKKARKLAL